MPPIVEPPLAPMNNWDIANVVKGFANPDYQARVPDASQANFAQVLEDMWDYQPNRNQFIDALLNQIGLTIFSNRVWNNKLARFKRGMLRRGETIQEIAVGIAQAHTYDATRDQLEKMIFGREPNEAQSFYHVRNRKDFYKVTIDETQLKLAFLSENGMFDFINGLLNSAYTGDNFDEFLYIVQLFKQYHKLNGFWKINVPDITAADATQLEAQTFLKALRTIAPSLEYPSRNYNAAHMPVWADASELLLIINSSAMAAVDVQALAAAFNPANTDIQPKTLVLPPEHFPIEGGLAILTTPDFFVIADTVYETREAENPAALIRNYFLHHHGVISASPFVPAILFTHTEESSSVEITPAEATGVTDIVVVDKNGQTVTQVERGNEYAVFAHATPEENPAKAVKLVLKSKTSGPLAPQTLLTQTGTLRVPVNEPSTVLTIDAIAIDTIDYPDVYATLDINVVGTYYSGPLPGTLREDDDDDGLYEALPVEPARQANTFTIPDVDGLQYRKLVTAGVAFTDTGDLVTVAKHNAKVGDTVVFGAITGTTGVTAGTTYYVKTVASADTFTIAATAGGTALVLTTDGTAASARFNVADGSKHTIAAATTFSAVADSGWEIKPADATASWSYTVV